MINFLKYRFIALIFFVFISVAMVVVGSYRYYTQGHVFSYSIDFTGGTQVLFRFNKPVSGVQLEKILGNNGWAGSVTREFSANNDVLVRVKEVATDATGLAERMRVTIQENLDDVTVSVLQNESVGAGIGADLRWKSVRAVVLALASILLYLAFRFWSFSFAVGAVIALFHDVIATLAIFLLFDLEISISVIGAILAALGYSANDTIVIFSQIRSNLATMKGTAIEEIANISLNQTLRRTILISFATTLTAGSMFVFGGPALREFSLALLVGIIFGTYSSIYVASAIMIKLYKEE
jgi:preprotein translocase subunit SecF